MEQPNTDQQTEDAVTIEIPLGGYPNDRSVPDVFAEGVGVQVNLTSLSLVFNRQTGHPAHVTPVAVVRMTLPQAVVMTQVMRRALKDYQHEVGPISIPNALLEALSLDAEL